LFSKKTKKESWCWSDLSNDYDGACHDDEDTTNNEEHLETVATSRYNRKKEIKKLLKRQKEE